MDSAYRYGGEEFTVILPETSGNEAEVVAQRIRTSVEGQLFFPAPDTKVRITVSIGVTEYVKKEELSAFIQRADKAMYQSKKNGRNLVSCLYDTLEASP
jgi:diguanylate cyclase (GGDEF)-like protein